MSDQIESAAALMVRDYLILALLVSLGALQISVSISGIRGLWLLPHRNLTRALGVLLIILGLGYYLLSPLWIEGPWAAGSVVDGTSENRIWGTAAIDEISAARNVNDIHGGMAGTAYAVFFVLSAVLATTFAAAIGAFNVRIMDSPSFRRRLEGGDDAVNPPSFRRGLGGGDDDAANPPSFRRGLGGGHTDGLDALKSTNPITTLKSSLRNLRQTGKTDIRNHLQSAHAWSIPSLIGRTWRN